MNLSQLRSRCKPHLWFQLYWVVYLVWFFWLDLTIKDTNHSLKGMLSSSGLWMMYFGSLIVRSSQKNQTR